MNTEKLINQIEELAAEYSDEYAWGIRFDTAGLAVGHIFPVSREWVDGEVTEEVLGGTCAVEILPSIGYKSSRSINTNAAHKAFEAGYEGVAYIVCGLPAGYCGRQLDAYETVLTDCEVMAIVEAK